MAYYKLGKTSNGIVFYGKIDLDATINESRKLVLTIDDLGVETEWHNVVEFGVRFFFEHFSQDFKKGLSVQVKSLHTMIVDSSTSIIFYITVMCLAEALGYDKPIVLFDKENGKFIIAK